MDDKKINSKKEDASEVDKMAPSEPGDFSADTLSSSDIVSVGNLINSYIEKIDKISEEIKPVKEMIESLLDADLEYAELELKVKEASQARALKKKAIMETSNGKELSEKLKSLRKELKDAKEALSVYLTEYQRRTGLNQFEGPDGELSEIVFSARLVRRKK